MKRLIHTLAATALLAIPTTAAAADHELSFELGTTGHSADDNWFLFEEYRDAHTNLGLRAGFAVHDRVAIIAGWQHGATGTRVEMDEEGHYFDDDGMYANLGAAYYNDTFSLGAKVDWPVAVWFQPYATLQALGISTKVRLDDAPRDDDSINQLEYSAFDPAGAATGGVEFRVPINHNEWAIASHMELGYQLGTAAQFDELGSLLNRGLIFRWGVGARF
jgi:hypothetical protein